MFRPWWIVPAGVGLVGVGLSCLAFWIAERADERRARDTLEFRTEWRARDIEAKVRLSGNAVENLAVAIAASGQLNPEQFNRIAARARSEIDHVNSLQWAPRVPRDQISAFEHQARASGLPDYRVFDVTPDFRPTELSEREEYFPVLYDARREGRRRVHGLALGRYDGRRIPMLQAQEEGRPAASLPVRPIGPPTAELVYLLFWPVYDGIEVPATVEERRAKFRGFAVGNYSVASLITAAIRDTPEIVGIIRFSIAAQHQDRASRIVAATYSPASRKVEPGPGNARPGERPALQIEREFTVFGQHWDLTFEYSAETVAGLRAQTAWVWLVAGILLTASLMFYLWRERGRTEAIAAQVGQRTAELERTAAQLHQAQKMEAIGNLTGGMAHDFNNLLSVVIGSLDLLKEQVSDDPDAVALADTALQAGIRGAELTRQLLAFARRQPLEPKLIDINVLVSDMTRLLRRTLGENVETTLIAAPDAWPVVIDPAQLNAAIANLATNARDAMPNGGRLTIETKNTHLDADYTILNPEATPGDYVLIEVSDTGTGMPPETLAHAFDPFFTTKEVGRGTGLGLSMVFGFVKQSQGHIKIYSEVGQGTTIRIYLPRAKPGREAPAAVVPPAPLRKGQETILVVEDNSDVRLTVAKQLVDLGYTVVEAGNARAALAILKNPDVKIDLLFTDLIMPGGMNGDELARAAAAARPGLKVLFTSGYPGSALRDGDRLADGEHLLSKPYRKQELARKLAEILDR